MQLWIGSAIIAAAIVAVVRRVEVRLVLLTAALALGILVRKPEAILQRFFTAFTSQEFVIPLCCAMGFAYVLRDTQCDRHLVHLLVRPLRRARALLLPGAVLVGFVVNIPIISQTSTAVAIGSVLIPLLLAARVPRAAAGAALLLGASIGGELLNQGAPEYRTISEGVSALGLPPVSGAALVRTTLPLDLLQLGVSLAALWWISARRDARPAPSGPEETAEHREADGAAAEPGFAVQPLKAAVPLVPLVLLFLVAEPFRVVPVPTDWLVGGKEAASFLQKAGEALKEPRYANAVQEAFNSRLIGVAMLIGGVVAACTDRKAGLRAAAAFFDGAGYALTHIVSLIVAAACFGEGVKQIGLDAVVAGLLRLAPGLLIPAAGFLSLGFGFISGSGIAATQSLYHFFAAPAVTLGVAPDFVGAVVSLGAAAGRTMSPVAAVALMSGSLTETPPTELVRRVAGPICLGMTAVVVVASLMVTSGMVKSPSKPPAMPAGASRP